MTPNQFFGRVARDLFEVEARFVFGDHCNEQRLHQQIAQLFRNVTIVIRCDGVGCLVGFLDDVARGARDGLLAIPGAFGAQPANHLDEPREFASFSVV